MKKLSYIFTFLMILMGSILILTCKNTVYAQEGVYFDENGNFVFCTYNKKATGAVGYKTVGWTMKKYKNAINAAGQTAVIIPMPKEYYAVDDTSNPGYEYDYFIVSKAEMLNYIDKVSVAWGKYLRKYGGPVYFDGIMTVTEGVVAKGGVYGNCTFWGEVYRDYEGISRARYWARPECLLDYFDISVTFPILSEPAKLIINEGQPENIFLTGTIMSSADIGSHAPGKEEFDVETGIPSGEDLYIRGTADKYYIEGTLVKRKGTVGIPVKVITDYELKWTDERNVFHSEIQRVERWYHVVKPFEYYTAGSVAGYVLSGVRVDGAVIDNYIGSINTSQIKQEKNIYGNAAAHISVSNGQYYAGKKTVYSKGKYRPDIPDENQQALAEKGNGNLKVRNDRLVLNGNTVLNDGWTVKGTYTYKISGESESVYTEGIMIDRNAENGTCSDVSVTYVYRGADKEKTVSHSVRNIAVHTPVVCKAGITAPKKYNMATEPKGNQIVAGTDFAVKISSVGEHRDIKGYGRGDYKKYAGDSYVKFPFDVVYKGKLFKSGDCIKIQTGSTGFSLPENVKLGTYTVEVMTFAYNAPSDKISDDKKHIIGRNANIEMSQYGGNDEITVEVIGIMMGFYVNDNEKSNYVGDRIGFWKKTDGENRLPIITDKKKTYTIGLKGLGIGDMVEDKVWGELSCCCMDGSDRVNVIPYIVGEYNYLGRKIYERAPEIITFYNRGADLDKPYTYNWQGELDLSRHIIFMPEGVEPSSDKIVNNYAVKDKNILINLKVYGYSGKNTGYSYVNVENFPFGYCNMWKTEGYVYNFSDENVKLRDGDCIILGGIKPLYQGYAVEGTH